MSKKTVDSEKVAGKTVVEGEKVLQPVQRGGNGFEEALMSLTGEYVWLWAINYVYAGILVDCSSTDVRLEEATLVLESGEFKNNDFKEFEVLPFPVHVRTAAIESFSKCWKRPKQ